MTGRWLLATLLLAPLSSGCFFFDYFDDDGYDEWGGGPTEIPEPYNDGSLVVGSSVQYGDMGDIRGYSGDAVASQASYYGTSSSVRLDSVGDGWWVMSYLSVSNLDIMNAAPGTYRSQGYSSSDVYLSVTGCSGFSYGNYTFDGGSVDTEVTIVDNGDGTRHLSFRATFEDWETGERTVGTGAFDYEAGEVAPPPSYEPYPSEPTYVERSIIASDAMQDGAMGDIVGYQGPAYASESYYYGSSASIRLDSDGDGWWVMSYLNVSNLDLVTAPAGTYRTSISSVYDGSEPYVGVTGCSGYSHGDYTYDGGANDVELVLSDNEDGSRTIDLTATYDFTGSPQTAHTRFTFRVM